MKEKQISKAVIKRLPRYRRYLRELQKKGIEKISSKDLSNLIGYTASQIRQDLNNFGGFGQQGYGYNVKYLYNEIGKILGLDKTYNMIIIGAGHLGQAIANYVKFEKRGFRIIGIFDTNPDLEGTTIRGIQIMTDDKLPAFLNSHDIDIATLTLPKTGAEEIAPLLVKGGVKAIWNFAHTDLDLPSDIVVENVHLSESLMQLSYNINRKDKKK